jgi:uncharacterized membrane protein
MSSSPTFRPETPPSERLLEMSGRLASGLALLCYLAGLGLLFSAGPTAPSTSTTIALLLLAATITTLISQSRQLSGLKILLAAGIIAVIGGIVHWVGVVTSVPFGPFNYNDGIGPKLFGKLAWATPLLWVIAVLNARGVARLILKPWRKLKHYGFWVIGITAGLVVLLNLALEPFATRVTRYWVWLPTKFPFTWHGMPLTNSLGWALTTLLMLAFVTPLLMNRSSRSRKSPPDYHPLAVWILLLVLFGAGAALENLWSAVALCAVAATVPTIFAIRGARW